MKMSCHRERLLRSDLPASEEIASAVGLPRNDTG